MPSFILYSLYAIAAAILVYKLVKARSRELIVFAALIIASILLFSYEHVYIALPISGIIIFSAIISSYGTWECYLFILAGIFYAAFAYPAGISTFLQSMFIGMLSGSYIAKQEKTIKQKKDPELRRNVAQILAGIAFIAIFYAFNLQAAALFPIVLIIAGSILGNYASTEKKNLLSKYLYGFERNGVAFGSGARWLAIGILVAISFLSRNLIISVFSAIFIGDSFSTLVGISIKGPKLPYNKRKSVIGTLAYFVCVLLISFPLIGFAALYAAAFAALFESQPLHIDDNFDVAVTMVLFFILLFHLGIIPST